MKEIKIYPDKSKEDEIKNNIEFEKIAAGETSIKKIYILNRIDYDLDVELKLKGKYIKIIKTIEKILPNQLKEVIFEFTPKITIMQPIMAQLKIKLNYVVK